MFCAFTVDDRGMTGLLVLLVLVLGCLAVLYRFMSKKEFLHALCEEIMQGLVWLLGGICLILINSLLAKFGHPIFSF
jgi:hypothetical protein